MPCFFVPIVLGMGTIFSDPLADISRFPGSYEARRGWQESLQLFAKLKDRRAMWYEDADRLDAMIAEVEKLRDVWEAIDDVRCWEFQNQPTRMRASLAKLRKLIGEENYAIGRLPPVPKMLP